MANNDDFRILNEVKTVKIGENHLKSLQDTVADRLERFMNIKCDYWLYSLIRGTKNGKIFTPGNQFLMLKHSVLINSIFSTPAVNPGVRGMECIS